MPVNRRGAQESTEQVLRWVTRPVAVVGTLAVLAIMLLTVLDVVWRNFVGGTFGGLVEYTQVLLVVAIFLGLGYTQMQGSHVMVDLLVNRLPPRTSKIVQQVALLVSLAVLTWLVWATAKSGLSSFSNREVRFGVASVPVWPAKLVIPFGLFLWWLALAYRLIWPQRPTSDVVSAAEGEVNQA